MALVKLYMSKVVNIEEKLSSAESHVGLVKAAARAELNPPDASHFTGAPSQRPMAGFTAGGMSDTSMERGLGLREREEKREAQ